MKGARARGSIAALLLAAPAVHAHAGEPLRNWFNDPFFRISSAIADCPVPAGPFITESERRVQAHHRAEKGTTCWLAHQCEQPNAYMYDAQIAADLSEALREHQPFADTSLWVTVQGRVIYVEGCVARASQEAEIEAFARKLAHVQQAIAIVRTAPNERPPYKLLGTP